MHQMALRILEELGMRVLLPEARRVFAAAGATVDEESRMVRLDRALVEESLAKAPREIELVAREPQRSVVIGGRNLAVVPVAGPPHVPPPPTAASGRARSPTIRSSPSSPSIST